MTNKLRKEAEEFLKAHGLSNMYHQTVTLAMQHTAKRCIQIMKKADIGYSTDVKSMSAVAMCAKQEIDAICEAIESEYGVEK